MQIFLRSNRHRGMAAARFVFGTLFLGATLSSATSEAVTVKLPCKENAITNKERELFRPCAEVAAQLVEQIEAHRVRRYASLIQGEDVSTSDPTNRGSLGGKTCDPREGGVVTRHEAATATSLNQKCGQPAYLKIVNDRPTLYYGIQEGSINFPDAGDLEASFERRAYVEHVQCEYYSMVREIQTSFQFEVKEHSDPVTSESNANMCLAHAEKVGRSPASATSPAPNSDWDKLAFTIQSPRVNLAHFEESCGGSGSTDLKEGLRDTATESNAENMQAACYLKAGRAALESMVAQVAVCEISDRGVYSWDTSPIHPRNKASIESYIRETYNNCGKNRFNRCRSAFSFDRDCAREIAQDCYNEKLVDMYSGLFTRQFGSCTNPAASRAAGATPAAGETKRSPASSSADPSKKPIEGAISFFSLLMILSSLARRSRTDGQALIGELFRSVGIAFFGAIVITTVGCSDGAPSPDIVAECELPSGTIKSGSKATYCCGTAEDEDASGNAEAVNLLVGYVAEIEFTPEQQAGSSFIGGKAHSVSWYKKAYLLDDSDLITGIPNVELVRGSTFEVDIDAIKGWMEASEEAADSIKALNPAWTSPPSISTVQAAHSFNMDEGITNPYTECNVTPTSDLHFWGFSSLANWDTREESNGATNYVPGAGRTLNCNEAADDNQVCVVGTAAQYQAQAFRVGTRGYIKMASFEDNMNRTIASPPPTGTPLYCKPVFVGLKRTKSVLLGVKDPIPEGCGDPLGQSSVQATIEGMNNASAALNNVIDTPKELGLEETEDLDRSGNRGSVSTAATAGPGGFGGEEGGAGSAPLSDFLSSLNNGGGSSGGGGGGSSNGSGGSAAGLERTPAAVNSGEGEDPSIALAASAGNYSGGGGGGSRARKKKGGGFGAGLAGLFGKKGGKKSATDGSALAFGAAKNDDGSPMGSSDRDDYFNLIDPSDSLFAVVHRRYKRETIGMARGNSSRSLQEALK